MFRTHWIYILLEEEEEEEEEEEKKKTQYTGSEITDYG